MEDRIYRRTNIQNQPQHAPATTQAQGGKSIDALGRARIDVATRGLLEVARELALDGIEFKSAAAIVTEKITAEPTVICTGCGTVFIKKNRRTTLCVGCNNDRIRARDCRNQTARRIQGKRP